VLDSKDFFTVPVKTLGALGLGVAKKGLRMLFERLVWRELASPTVAGHTGEGPAIDDITDLVISVLVAEDQLRTDPAVFVFDATANRASVVPAGGSEFCGSTPIRGGRHYSSTTVKVSI